MAATRVRQYRVKRVLSERAMRVQGLTHAAFEALLICVLHFVRVSIVQRAQHFDDDPATVVLHFTLYHLSSRYDVAYARESK